MLSENKKVPEVLDAQMQTESLSFDEDKKSPDVHDAQIQTESWYETVDTFEELQEESGNDKSYTVPGNAMELDQMDFEPADEITNNNYIIVEHEVVKAESFIVEPIKVLNNRLILPRNSPKPARFSNEKPKIWNESFQSPFLPNNVEKYVAFESKDAIAIVPEKIVKQNKKTAKPVLKNVFACDKCNRSFSLQQQLEIHVKIHSRERNFACGLCSKKFLRKPDLEKHMFTHTKQKPFEVSQNLNHIRFNSNVFQSFSVCDL